MDDEEYNARHERGESEDITSSPWTFHDARATPPTPTHQRSGRLERPRVSRHSSLPRSSSTVPTYLGNVRSSGSIFGNGGGDVSGDMNGGSPRRSSVEGEDDGNNIHPERPPLLSITHPSQDSAGPPPLSSLAAAGPSTTPPVARDMYYGDAVRATSDRRRMPTIEKDADDPSTPPPPASTAPRPGVTRQQSTTRTTLSRLFAVQAAVSPDISRHASYGLGSSPILSSPTTTYNRYSSSPAASDLPNHLYTQGLLSGLHSDITVHAFGHPYKLHRLLLTRAPFFTSALSAPWLEAHSKEITVHPSDIDSNITRAAFDLALKRLYGASVPAEESRDPIALFATACWLELPDLVADAVAAMLRQMSPATLSPLIRLVTNDYYGRAGDKILASAKAMLCRDGWRMPLRNWDGIPGDIIREIVGGDGFYVTDEFARWSLARRLLDRRLKRLALDDGLRSPGNKRRVRKVPEGMVANAVRFDGTTAAVGFQDSLQQWVSLYTHPSVEPLLVLLDEGVHYVHLEFEQLQSMRTARDVLGFSVMPERVVSSALWAGLELRQRVLNAAENALDLDLSVSGTGDNIAPSSLEDSKGKQRSIIDDGSNTQPRPRKFWIPLYDCNILMGGAADPISPATTTSPNPTLQSRHSARLSATLNPEDVQWASDFTSLSTPHPPARPLSAAGPAVEEVRYTYVPPFRFAAEFPHPRLLKERKRVYSRTVFYAGSLWNVYVQKVVGTRGKQLGVYLHRAKEREAVEDASLSTVGRGGVDERIAGLEREMANRRERRRQRARGVGSDEAGTADEDLEVGIEVESEGDTGGSGNARTTRRRRRNHRGTIKAGQIGIDTVLGSSPGAAFASSSADDADVFVPRWASDDEASEPPSSASSSEDESPPPHSSSTSNTSTLPPYIDARPTIRTYFKIYSPSRGGRMLSVYESAPDKFNFSQSWGWKSSTLMLDEGMMFPGEEAEEATMGEEGRGDIGGDVAAGLGDGGGKVRFMVVIGNI